MKTIKKLLTILLLAFATVAGAQNNWYAPSVFHENVNFKKIISHTNALTGDTDLIFIPGPLSTMRVGKFTACGLGGYYNGAIKASNYEGTLFEIKNGNIDSCNGKVSLNYVFGAETFFGFPNNPSFFDRGEFLHNIGSGNTRWDAIGNYAWGLTGNAGTNPATNFLGTTDHKALVIKTNDSLTITQDGQYVIEDTVTHTRVGIFNAKRTGVRGWCAERFNGTTMFNSYLQETGIGKVTGGMGAFDTAKLCRANISVGHENGEYFAQVQYGYGGADTSLRNELIADSLGIRIGLQNAAVATTFQVDNNVETIFGVTKDGAYYLPIGATDGYVFTVDGSGFATWTNPSSIDYSSVPSYANNAAAFAVLGAGKLYYTDVAGEYILKVTH